MTIQFMEPLSRAWRRMKIALFKPFDLHKWFVIGFNAFLAGLLSVTNGSSGSRSGNHGDFGEFIHFPRTAWEWLMNHPGWAVAILFGVLVVIVVLVVLTWVGSRGVFMFLESVVHDRVEIARPWREYQKEGNSLFVWRLVFGLIVLAVFAGLGVWFFAQGAVIYDQGLGRVIPIGLILGLGLLTLAAILIIGYITLFLQDFVAALMFKHRISAVAAWRMFLAIFRQHAFYFLAYGIIIFFLTLAFVAAVIVAGLITCCVGWLLLIIPYIGTVVTLPFWYLLRSFSLEFLAQFGPDYEVFPKPAAPAAPAPAAPAV